MRERCAILGSALLLAVLLGGLGGCGGKKERSLGLLLDVDASRLASMTLSRGGDFMDAGHTTYTLDTPQVRASLELMRQLVKEGCVELLGEQNADTQEFAVGQVLFVLDSSSGLPFVKVGVKSGLGFDWDVAAPPHEGEHPVVNVYGASVSVCQTTPAQQLAAWLFLKWFTEPAQQARWVKASHYFPVRRSTARELEGFFAENPTYKTAYELLDYGKSEPSVSGYESVRRLIAQAMVEIVEGGDMAQVLGRLEKEANATLQGAGAKAPVPVKAALEVVDPKNQKVVFWYQHTREREEALQQLIAEFNQRNPYGIQVRGEYAGTYSEIYNKMVVGIQSHSLPQLVVAYQNQALAYYQNQGIVDLQPYMDSPRWGLNPEDRTDLFPAFLEQDQVQGVQIAFPPNRSMEILYYNRDWLRELGYAQPPRTWDEFAQMCRKAKVQPFSQNKKSAL